MPTPAHDAKRYRPTLADLQWDAERLARRIERSRARGPFRARPRPRWRRALQVPVTARQFERVFHAQGVPWGERWVTAVKLAWLTCR
jgi:hypothetical protein